MAISTSSSMVHLLLVSKVEVTSGDILAQIIAALGRLGPTNIRTLARETRHGCQTILKHLEQLRQAGRVIATIPEDVPFNHISPGWVVLLLVPPDKAGNEQDGQGARSDEGNWEPF